MKTLRKELADKEYRDAFVEAHIRTGIAIQTRVIREQRGLSQLALADLMNTKQSVISRIENEVGNISTTTLLSVARALDVSLFIRFISLDKLLDETSDLSQKAMEVASYRKRK